MTSLSSLKETLIPKKFQDYELGAEGEACLLPKAKYSSWCSGWDPHITQGDTSFTWGPCHMKQQDA